MGGTPVETLHPAPDIARTPGAALWASHEVARGRGRRERARGLTRLGSSARMLHWPTLREGRETQRSVAGGRSARAAAPDGSGLRRYCSAQRRALPEPGLACAAPLGRRRRRRRRLLCSSSSGSSGGRHGQGQRGAHPRAARYEVAFISGRPVREHPDPVLSCGSPQPGASYPPHAPSLSGSPFLCISVLALLSVEHPSLPHSPHPIRTFLSRSRPSRSSVTGAVPWRSWGLILSVLDPPLRKASSLPSESPSFPPPSPGGARRWELPLVLTAAYLNTLPPPGPAPELALERPLRAQQRLGQWGIGGSPSRGPD